MSHRSLRAQAARGRPPTLSEALARFRGARPMPFWPPTWTGSPARSSTVAIESAKPRRSASA